MKRNYLKTTNPFAKRILEIIEEYKMINPNNLANELGMESNSVLMRVFSVEDRFLSGENVKKFLIRFPDLNARWFLLGEGKMKDKIEISQSIRVDDKNLIEKIHDLLLRIEDKDRIIRLQEDKIKQLERI